MDRKQQRRKGGKCAPSAQQSVTHADLLQRALEWFSNGCDFTNLTLHGNVGWDAIQVVVLAALWAWSDRSTLTKGFDDARQLAIEMFGSVAVNTYQGLTGALRSYTDQLLPQLWSHMQQRMEQTAGEHWRIGRWLALAVDGSRITTPRTVSNEQAFAIKNYGHGRKAKQRCKWKNKKRRSKRISEPVKPQIWLTLIWHMGLKLPWCWKTGPSTASERGHLLELLAMAVFPKCTLFCGDAGFVGYEFWRRDAMRNWSRMTSDPAALARQLRAARKDAYQRTRKKQGRYRPQIKDKPCATEPNLRQATARQRRDYKAFCMAA